MTLESFSVNRYAIEQGKYHEQNKNKLTAHF